MHLGMSGSFRIEAEGKDTLPARTYHPRGKLTAHDHVVFDLSSGARVIFNDPRRFGVMDLIPPQRPRRLRRFSPGWESSRSATRLSGALIADAVQGPRRAAEGDAARPDADRRARQHLCLRGAVAGAAVAVAGGRNARPPGERPRPARPTPWPSRSARCWARRSPPADRRCAIIARRPANSAISSTSFAVYDREGEPCPRPDCSGVVRRMVQSGRSTFYCPVCQK